MSPLTQSELLERIIWVVDGYRLGYFDMVEVVARVGNLIEDNPEAVNP